MTTVFPFVLVAILFSAVSHTNDAHGASDLAQWTLHASEDGVHPDQNEQQIVWLMNRARQNPAQEGVWLSQTSIPSIQQARKQYRVSERRLRKQFRKIKPTAPAAFDFRLYQAALVHAKRLARKQKQNHRGQMKAIKRSGFPLASCRGNVFSYATSAINAHAAFNIDWGDGWGGTQRGVGHRKALMATEEVLDRVGIAVVDAAGSRRVGPLVVVGNYCRPMVPKGQQTRRFFVGTVFADANGNQKFDPGEGVSGVRVESKLSRWFALTASGGGYALPRDDNGRGQLQFESEKTGRHLVSVDKANTNALVDLVLK